MLLALIGQLYDIEDRCKELLAGATDYASLCPHVWKRAHPEAIRTYRADERRDAANRKRLRRRLDRR